MPYILWADRTTPKNATGQTPFSLVYRREAVLEAEVKLPSSRHGLMTVDKNTTNLTHDLDVVEELHDAARIWMEVYRRNVSKCYNKNGKVKVFKVGDWVMR